MQLVELPAGNRFPAGKTVGSGLFYIFHIDCVIYQTAMQHDAHSIFRMGKDESKAAFRRIGANIRKIRHENGLSQEKLSAMVGIERGYLSQIESGKKNPSVKKLMRIADGLDVPLTALFEGLGECPPSQLKGDVSFAAIKAPATNRRRT